MRRMRVVLLVVVLLGAMATTEAAPVGAGTQPALVQFVHGVGTLPGDNPVDVYIAEEGATSWALVPGGPMSYTDQRELTLAVGVSSVLLCAAVADPAQSVESCPEGAVNPGGTDVDVPDTDPAVLVAGYDVPEGEELPVVFDLFEVDTGCLFVEEGRFQVAHAAAMGNVTLFIDGARDDREPISNGESVTAVVTQGAYDLLLVTEGDEFFVLDEPDVVAGPAATTFLAVVGPGDPTPLDPTTTDLRFVPIAFGVEPCPEPPAPSTTTTPEPEPPAPPQPAPADFTG